MKTNKPQYFLFLNASKDKELDVFLIKHKAVIDQIKQTGDYKVTEYLLKSIEQILKRNQLKAAELSGIMAITGPGAFTSLRIICVIANTLAYSLKIPVVGLINKQGLTNDEKLIKLGLSKISKAKAFQYISPFYNHKPNITMAK